MAGNGSTKPKEAEASFCFVGGDKGGVGKSFAAMTLIDYLANQGESVVVIETDKSNPDVARMYDGTMPCYHVDIASTSGWMDLMDITAKHLGSSFVMSTPGGAGPYLKKHLPEFVSFLKRGKSPMGFELWWVMNPQHDSVNLLADALEHYGEHFSRIRVVRNLHFAGDGAAGFYLWDDSPLRLALEKKGAITLDLEGLHLRVVVKLFDPKRIMPFSDAADAALGEKVGLTVSELHKLISWRERQFTNFGRAFVATSLPKSAASTNATAANPAGSGN